MTRAEKDAAEAARKKAAYDKKHAAGLTDEAKADKARLLEIKARREAAEAKKKEAEEEEARVLKAIERAKKKALKEAAAGGGGDDDKLPKLDAREVKKMNPAALKEALKERGLSTQGSKKDLLTRLLEACK